jgi:hypothetical protein
VELVVRKRAAKKARKAEVQRVERLVGTSRMRSLPFHIWCRATIEAGRASPELLAAAERARAEWDAVLPTLPTLVVAPSPGDPGP